MYYPGCGPSFVKKYITHRLTSWLAGWLARMHAPINTFILMHVASGYRGGLGEEACSVWADTG